MKLSSILTHLRESYCGYIGWDIKHIHEREKVIFIREKAEAFGEWKRN